MRSSVFHGIAYIYSYTPSPPYTNLNFKNQQIGGYGVNIK
jgi:hypothetical protein